MNLTAVEIVFGSRRCVTALRGGRKGLLHMATVIPCEVDPLFQTASWQVALSCSVPGIAPPQSNVQGYIPYTISALVLDMNLITNSFL